MLAVKNLNIDTGRNGNIFLHKNSEIIATQGFKPMDRVKAVVNGNEIGVTINFIDENLLDKNEIGLCTTAKKELNAKNGDSISLKSIGHLESFSSVRAKMFGKEFNKQEMYDIVKDIVDGNYSDVHIASFATSCEGIYMSDNETAYLTNAMIETGDKMSWNHDIVVDKHCIGGIPGNRTTNIVIPIVAEYGLHIPKTSSRAITSPSGTADTMEVLAPVDLTTEQMKNVVNKVGGCMVWGGSVTLSPSDDLIIKVKKELDIDSEGQMIASIVSKKIAAGSTHILIDIPVGPTAKVRTKEDAMRLKSKFETLGKNLGSHILVLISDGIQPIGNGIGPALEAKDIVATLKNETNAPQDLLEKGIELAGAIIEFSPNVKKGEGEKIAREIIESGRAWKKFEEICEAQGGMRVIPQAKHTLDILAKNSGKVFAINNRKISQMAKIAGAPEFPTAGIYIYKHLNERVEKGEKLVTIHSESPAQLEQARALFEEFEIIEVK